jgi:hypothetical protein
MARTPKHPYCVTYLVSCCLTSSVHCVTLFTILHNIIILHRFSDVTFCRMKKETSVSFNGEILCVASDWSFWWRDWFASLWLVGDGGVYDGVLVARTTLNIVFIQNVWRMSCLLTYVSTVFGLIQFRQRWEIEVKVTSTLKRLLCHLKVILQFQANYMIDFKLMWRIHGSKKRLTDRISSRSLQLWICCCPRYLR